MSFRLSRRQMISGMAALGALAGAPARNAFAQKRVTIPEGDFAPLRRSNTLIMLLAWLSEICFFLRDGARAALLQKVRA